MDKIQGRLEADNGVLEIPPSNSSCLWIIKLENMTGIKLEMENLTTNPLTLIPTDGNDPQAIFQRFRTFGLEETTIEFGGKVLVILAPPQNQQVSLRWTGLTLNTTKVFFHTSYYRSLERTLYWFPWRSGSEKIISAIEPQAAGQFNWSMSLNVSHCGEDVTSQCSSLVVVHMKPDGTISNNYTTSEGSSAGSCKVEKNSKLLVFLHKSSSVGTGSKLRVTVKPDQDPLEKNVTGILVGTEGGLYVVALNPAKIVQISAKDINGVAFDWNSKKMYWAETGAGIMRANVDGSDFEQLIVDHDIRAVKTEPITGNLYYSSSSRNSLRVCNNNGKKCSTIISSPSGETWDIGFHQSRGFLFWCIPSAGEIVRAHFDGSNATQIDIGWPISIYGIAVDESGDWIYVKDVVKIDLNDYSFRLPGILPTRPTDLEVDAKNLYYSSYTAKSLNSVLKEDFRQTPTLIAEFTNSPKGVALFGTQVSPRRSNPCENSECTHLCVLITASSHRCLCPDGERLMEDGVSCGI